MSTGSYWVRGASRILSDANRDVLVRATDAAEWLMFVKRTDVTCDQDWLILDYEIQYLIGWVVRTENRTVKFHNLVERLNQIADRMDRGIANQSQL